MSARRHRLLIRCFPRAWRDRYGDELDALLVEAGDGRGARVRASLDVMRAGLGERLRASGLAGDERPAPERARARLLLVLAAWALFVVAGVAVQKSSEHWKRAMPASERGIPATAFTALQVLAAIATALVLAGIAIALPVLADRVRTGRTAQLRRPILRALTCSLATLAVTVPLIAWARHLNDAQRNGGDTAYGFAVAGCALLAALTLAAWTAAAVAAAVQTPLDGRRLALEVGVGASVTAAMLAMSGATIVWWLSLGSRVSGVAGIASAVMVVASAAAAVGSVGAIRAAASGSGPEAGQRA